MPDKPPHRASETLHAAPAPAPEPAVEFTPALALAEAVNTPTCPTCGGELAPYTGTNLLKADTGFCTACGARHRLVRASDEAAA